MKNLARALVIVLVVAIALSLVPALEAPASAAATPVLVLKSTSNLNPILDHKLTLDLFGSGGPFTVTFDWKAVGITPSVKDDPNGYGWVEVSGTYLSNGTRVTQANPGLKINGTTNWQSKRFQFQNVATYPMPGKDEPGNILRFFLYQAVGELHVRNIKITNNSGKVMYDLNADADVQQALTNAQAQGLKEFDMGDLAILNFKECPWVAGSFAPGAYSAYGYADGSSTSNTTNPITLPPKNTTSSSSVVTPPPVQNTTKPPVQNTTKPPVQNTTKPPVVTDPCAKGHNYVNGFCSRCGITQPGGQQPPVQNTTVPPVVGPDNPIVTNPPILNNNTTIPTQAPTQAPTNPPVQNNNNSQGGGITIDPVWLIVFVMVFAVGICVVVLYATGVFNKKK